jgi:hypothetical protein
VDGVALVYAHGRLQRLQPTELGGALEDTGHGGDRGRPYQEDGSDELRLGPAPEPGPGSQARVGSRLASLGQARKSEASLRPQIRESEAIGLR